MSRIAINGERVQVLREESGKTQRAFAAEVGVSERTIRRAESGAPVRAKTARGVAEALGLPPNRSSGLARILH